MSLLRECMHLSSLFVFGYTGVCSLAELASDTLHQARHSGKRGFLWVLHVGFVNSRILVGYGGWMVDLQLHF